MTAESIEVTVARISENMLSLHSKFDEVTDSVKHATASIEKVAASAARTEMRTDSHADTIDTLWTKLDAQRGETDAIVKFVEQIRGAGKAIIWLLSIGQGILLLLLVWLFSSVATLREQKAVSDYRLQQLEKPHAKADN